ncbi:MAG: Lrp/AsnC ligand binding domain-containing protein, partial [candidate division NC10 bacterium]|nr:Lrp/AsnC ligand binding domain-containing protein [candidate division NC10 bacterium]
EATKARDLKVAEAIMALPGVTRADVVTGRFDVIVMVEVDELGALWDTVDKIQALPAVVKTTTNVVVQR